jgi:hypothetical protein
VKDTSTRKPSLTDVKGKIPDLCFVAGHQTYHHELQRQRCYKILQKQSTRTSFSQEKYFFCAFKKYSGLRITMPVL